MSRSQMREILEKLGLIENRGKVPADWTPWYRLEAKDGGKRLEVLIYEPIGEDFFGEGVGPKRLREDLQAAGPELEVIDVRINSPGGSLFDAQAIFNLLRGHTATVNVFVDGIAASAASLVAMAGDRVVMPENSMMMVHDPRGIVMGTATTMRSFADVLDKAKEGMVAVYRGKTGLGAAEIGKLLSAETWLTAKEAKDKGFADEVTDKVEVAAHFDLSSIYAQAPQQWDGDTPWLVGQRIQHGDGGSVPEPTAGRPAAQEPTEVDMSGKMTPELITALVALTATELEQHNPALVKALRDEGAQGVDLAKVRADAAEAERKRIQEIRDSALPGQDELVNRLCFEEPATVEAAATAFLKAEKEARAAALTGIQTGSPAPAPAVLGDPGGGTGADPNLPLADRCKAEWQKDSGLRAEFNDDLEAYVAFKDAEENGQVRYLRDRSAS